MSFKQFVLPAACTILGLLIGSPMTVGRGSLNRTVSDGQKKLTAKAEHAGGP
jgi:hypothetical protein